MRVSNFTLLLTLAILMVIGVALLPSIDVADNPRPRQGKTLTVSYSWPKASAKVIEQNVTSRIEGLVSSVKGVESVSSESYFGSGHVVIELKKEADVSSTKFEISSLLKQVYKKLPEGVSYPSLTGGEVVNERGKSETTQLLLTYQVNSNLSDEQLKEYIERKVEPELKRLEDVKRVEVTGGVSKYIEITYNPFVLANYGLSAYDIETGIRSFMGREDIVGEVIHDQKRIELLLATDKFVKPLEEIPIGQVDGKTVYLNDLATYEYKNREPDSYYRVNGLNTIYLNIHVDAQTNKIALSGKLQEQMQKLESQLKKGVYLTLTYDGAEERVSELNKLVWRSLMALGILLIFIWLAKREWKYLTIMVVTLAAIILTAVIAYWLFDIRLHIYSLAGITVSLGLVIDASVVMTDHYSYYRNRKAFLAIMAALLTTIGSLVVVFWLPEFLQKDLYDFARIIIINLSVALLVAYAFTPALIDQMKYRSYQQGHIRRKALVRGWTCFYSRYIAFTQKWKWIYIILVVMAFVLTVVVSFPLGILVSRREGSVLDKLILVVDQICMSIPPVFVGILLCFLFGITLRVFTPGRFVPFAQSPGKFLAYMFFPALAVALGRIAVTVKMLRSSILEEMNKDYIRTAFSRGRTRSEAMWKHALRNAVIPVIAVLAVTAAELVASSIVVEQVFTVPGIGRLLLASIGTRDFPVAQAIVVLLAAWVVIVNFVADVIYQYVDPRIRIQ